MLLVWLPLNNDLRNIGLSDLQFSLISTNTTHTSNYYTNNSNTNGGLVSDKTINLGNKQSMFCWVYLNSFYASSNLTGIVGLHRFPVCRGMGITMKYLSSTTGKLSVNTGNGNGGRTYNTYTGNTTLNAGKWYHVGYTYDNGAIKLYVNGVLDGTYNVVSSIVSDYIQIFGWSFASGTTVYGNYKLNGRIRDVRIYDHCLSAKEVKELSKGLILHYKFNESEILRSKCKNITWNQLVDYSTITASGSSKGVSYVTDRSKGKITFNGLSSAYNVIYINLNAVPVTQDHIYIFNGCPPGGYNADATAAAGGTYDLSIAPSSGYLRDYGDGIRWQALATGTVRIYPRFASGYNANNVVFYPKMFDLTLMFGSGNEPSLEEFKTMFPALTYQYDTGTLKDLSLPIPDCSGFGYDATPSGALTLSGSSPKYNKCIQFVNNSYLRLPDAIPKDVDAFTISVWIKPTVNQTGCIWNGRTTVGQSFAAFYINGKIRFDDDASQLTHGNFTFLNTWVHLICTYTRNGSKYVKIGSDLSNAVSAGGGSHTNQYATIGMSSYNDGTPSGNLFIGYMSDFRIYLTADNNMEHLTQMAIDDAQNLYCYELSEENSKKQINITGIYETPEYLEDQFTDNGLSATRDVRIAEDFTTANQLIEL